MVLRVENGVRPEGLGDVLVKVGGEGQVGVEVVHEAAVVRRAQDQQHVVVPDHQLLLRAVGQASPAAAAAAPGAQFNSIKKRLENRLQNRLESS